LTRNVGCGCGDRFPCAQPDGGEIALQSTNESLLANADALFEEKERAQVTLNSSATL